MAFTTPTLYDPSAAADGTLDGVASWSKGNFFGSSLSVLSHLIRAAATTGGCYWRDPFASNQQAWVRLSTLGADKIVLHLRGTGYATGPETGYAAYADIGAGNIGFARVDAGVIGLIGVTTPATFASTDLLGASISGSTLSLYKNSEATLLASMTDSTYATGTTIGLQLYDTATRVSLFGGGTLSTTFNVTLSASQAQSPRAARAVGRVASVTQAQTARAGRAVARTVRGSQASTVLVPRFVSRTLRGTQSQAALVTRVTGHALTASQASASTITRTKAAARTLSANQPSAGVARRLASRALSTTQAQSATENGIRARLLTLTATQASTAALGRNAGRVASAVQVSAVTVRRTVSRALGVAQTATLASARATMRTLSATSATTAGVIKGLSRRFAASATATPTVHGTHGGIASILTASVTGSATVGRGAARTIRVMASTVASKISGLLTGYGPATGGVAKRGRPGRAEGFPRGRRGPGGRRSIR